MSASESGAALEGVRIVELAEALAGPYCGMILGDLGADVIKIERPGSGDQSRAWGPPFVGTESAYYLSINRNKRSVALDIKSGEDRADLARLLDGTDVFVCNVRGDDSLRAAGLDPETLCARNPRLVYCSITAYGRTGPYAGRGGYDVVAQAEAGLMAATGATDGGPMRWPVAIADLSTGVWSAVAVLAALHARKRTGLGQYLDQSLLEAQLSWSTVMAAQLLATGRPASKLGNRHANIVPYDVFRARDRHLVVAAGTEEHWRRLCGVLGLGDDVRDGAPFATNAARLRNRDALYAVLEPVIADRDADHWLERLRRADIPCGPVNTLDEALRDPQVRHRGMVVGLEHPAGPVELLGVPLRLSETPVAYRRRPPLLGEHTGEVLAELRGRPGLRRPTAVEPEPLRTLRRDRRYFAEVPVGILHEGAVAPGVTLNLSTGGCALRVHGPSPQVDDELRLEVATRSLRASARAMVRWVREDRNGERTVGLQVRAEWPGASGWQALVASVAQGGAASEEGAA